MPIDIKLLRNEQDAEMVCQWQRLRQRQPSHTDSIIAVVAALDRDARHALSTLNKYKTVCRQERKRPDPNLLQSYQHESDKLALEVQQKLYFVQNAIDESLLSEFQHYDNSLVANINPNSILGSPYRRLIEFGAWDVIGKISSSTKQKAPSDASSSSALICWAGVGMDWAHALSAHLTFHIRTKAQPQPQLQLLQLPKYMPLEATCFHDMMGCPAAQPPDSCDICTAGTILQAPSWLTYLKLQYSDQTWGDKQLPKVISYSTTPSYNSMNDDIGWEDPRDHLLQKSWAKHQTSTHASTSLETHSVLILTSSTYYDSRSVQKEWAERMESFYRSLLPPECMGAVRQRVVSSLDLLPAESSRMVVEGCLPGTIQADSHKSNNTCTNTQAEEQEWVILGYLSNFGDYISRSCRIKNNQQQFCHIIQGQLCKISETMCWQAAHATTAEAEQPPGGHTASSSIRFSEALARHFSGAFCCNDSPAISDDDHPGEMTLQQTHYLEKAKNGRVQVKPVPLATSRQSTKSAAGQPRAMEASRLHPSNDETSKSSTVTAKKSKALPLLEPSNTPASRERIQAELLSSPHDFLPFYQ